VSWRFDELDDYAFIADDPVMDLPNADWTIGGWMRMKDNVGFDNQLIIMLGTFATNNSMHWYLPEGGSPARLVAYAKDNAGNFVAINKASIIPALKWTHGVFRRLGGVFTLWVNGNLVATGSPAFSFVSPTTGLSFGRRSDSGPNQFYGGDLAEWFKVDRALSGGEITALAQGMSPGQILGRNSWWIRMHPDRLTEECRHLPVSQIGFTSAPHPPVEEWPSPIPLANLPPSPWRPYYYNRMGLG